MGIPKRGVASLGHSRQESNDPGRLTARVGITLVLSGPEGPVPRGDQPPRMLRKQSLQ
jgi:hypothetical protein